MASCQTTQWVGSAPYVKLTVTQSSQTATKATLSWTLQYIVSSPADASARSYSVTINGDTVGSGTYNIDGVTGTKTIASGTKTITKTKATQSINFGVSFAFNLTWSGVYKGTLTADSSISVSAKTSYTVTFNANGGSGAPSSQKKWHGESLTLSSTKPTKTGHSFLGWSTSKSATSATWAAGGSYTTNASDTLYAVWKADTYTVTYNANGGSDAPSKQTKTYGKTLTLSTVKPTRTNYTFKGWATSASGSVVYASGASYTANAAATLYAVWELAYVKPRITNLSISRCLSDKTISDEGQNALVVFNWASDRDISSITVEWKVADVSVTDWDDIPVEATGTSGTVEQVVGDDLISNESTYYVRVTVTDSVDESSAVAFLSGLSLSLDFKLNNKGGAVGKPAELDDVFDIAYQTRHLGGTLQPVLEAGTDFNQLLVPNIYTLKNASSAEYSNCPITNGTGTLTVENCGEEGQTKQRLTTCSKTVARTFERFYYQDSWGDWVCVSDFGNKLLWGSTTSNTGYYMTETHNITFAEPVSKQPTGVVFVFSAYSDGAPQNHSFNSFFVPKQVIALQSGMGHCFQMCNLTLNVFAVKYLYITDTGVTGNAANDETGTANSGITYNNKYFVLRYVIGV